MIAYKLFSEDIAMKMEEGNNNRWVTSGSKLLMQIINICHFKQSGKSELRKTKSGAGWNWCEMKSR